jgi:peptidoglycan LD-endopeptidase CwlK
MMAELDKVYQGLNLNFRIKVLELARICRDNGVEMKIYCGIRTAEEQAILFRKTRTRAQVEQKAQSLTDKGFPFLAKILFDVGPQTGTLGKHVTQAGPGESWHQYGLAVDSVPILYGKALWEPDTPEWEIYGAVAGYLGLDWAGNWKGFKEMPHVQMHRVPSPLSFFNTEDKVRENIKVSL